MQAAAGSGRNPWKQNVFANLSGCDRQSALGMLGNGPGGQSRGEPFWPWVRVYELGRTAD